MKIVIVHGQSHKQISYHMGRMMCDAMQPEDIKEFFLPKDMPHFCTGCQRCLDEGIQYCPHKELQPIIDAIMDADVLVFTTPVYCLRTTGSMKALLDHCFTLWMPHRPRKEMFIKQAIILSVGAGSGMGTAAKDIKTSLQYWGISKIQVYKVRGMAISWDSFREEGKKKMRKDFMRLAHKVRNRHTIKVSIKIKVIFYMMRIMHKKKMSGSELDYTYWNQQGWLEKERPWR